MIELKFIELPLYHLILLVDPLCHESMRTWSCSGSSGLFSVVVPSLATRERQRTSVEITLRWQKIVMKRIPSNEDEL